MTAVFTPVSALFLLGWKVGDVTFCLLASGNPCVDDSDAHKPPSLQVECAAANGTVVLPLLFSGVRVRQIKQGAWCALPKGCMSYALSICISLKPDWRPARARSSAIPALDAVEVKY